MITGIDVSHHNGDSIDWAKVAKAGYQFVYVKVSEGTTFADHRAKANVAGAQAAGLLVGMYHYFLPNGDATAQYRWFEQCLQEAAGGFAGLLPPALDVEGDDNNLLGTTSAQGYALSAVDWLMRLEQEQGVKGIVYTYPSMAALGGIGTCLSRYPLWAASYREAGKPAAFKGWGDKWLLHQWSDKGTVPGVGSGSVDCNVFAGTIEDLRKLVVAQRPTGQTVKIIKHATGEKIAEYTMVPDGDKIAEQGKVYVR